MLPVMLPPLSKVNLLIAGSEGRASNSSLMRAEVRRDPNALPSTILVTKIVVN